MTDVIRSTGFDHSFYSVHTIDAECNGKTLTVIQHFCQGTISETTIATIGACGIVFVKILAQCR